MVEEKFKVRIEKYENEINLYKKSSDRIGYLRLVTAIGAGYYIYKLFKEPILVINIVISSLLLLFFYRVDNIPWEDKRKNPSSRSNDRYK